MTYRILYFYWKKKAFKICLLVNLVEKIWSDLEPCYLSMHVVETQKVYLMLTFSSVWSTNRIKKVEKMLQLLSTHNSECEALSYFWSIKYPEKGPFTCGDQSAPMGIPAEVKGTIKLNYTYSVTWEVRGQP